MLFQLDPRRDGWYVWLFALIFAFKLVLPAAFTADDPENQHGWMLICSSFGSRIINTANTGDSPDPAALHQGDCVLCQLTKHAGDAVLLSSMPVNTPLRETSPLPATEVQASFYLRSFRTPPLRGPPGLLVSL